MFRSELSSLRAIGHPWHAGHNYELLKLPFSWSYLPGDWHSQFRPFPDHVKWIDWDFDPSQFDIVITHISHEGFSYFSTFIDKVYGKIPIIAIMHGMPTDQGMKDAFHALVGDVQIVCNSYEQEKEWGFLHSTTIIHGFDPLDWPMTSYVKNEAVVSLPGINEDYPHFGANYGIALLNKVRSIVPVTWIRRDIGFSNWYDYREYLSSCSIYFNPTQRSPMPRARGECMMMGLVPVTTNHMGEWRFIEDGVNGFLVPDDPTEIADVICQLTFNSELCREMGRRARETARERFGISRWASDWICLIQQVLRS